MWHHTQSRPALPDKPGLGSRPRSVWKLCAAIIITLLSVQSTRVSAKANPHPDYTQLFPAIFARQGPPLQRVALTFDDGPDNVYTPQILRILAREHVHATFFVLGEQAERYPQMTRRIVREGHTIGNHTFDHRDLARLSARQMRWEVDQAERDILRLTGRRTKWFRPPYGSVNAQVLTALGQMGYQAVNWTVDSRDWRGLSAQQVEHNIVGATFPGAIILQHCSGNKQEILTGTVRALPAIIHKLRAKGYTFVTMPELWAPETRAVHARRAARLSPGASSHPPMR